MAEQILKSKEEIEAYTDWVIGLTPERNREVVLTMQKHNLNSYAEVFKFENGLKRFF